MSNFVIPSGSKLTIQILDSVKPESWAQTYSWSGMTLLLVRDQEDAGRIKAVYPTAKAFTFDERKIVHEYCAWKVAQKLQTPAYMPIDSAAQQGHAVAYADNVAEVKGAVNKTIPACRVPLATPELWKNAKGIPGVRMGSDVIAASVASMTRWTGKEVAFSMPVDTMAKYQFLYAKPEGIRPFLASIPSGTQSTGMKGRIWAYFLMAQCQQMSTEEYLTFMTDWCRAMFNLPRPVQNIKLPIEFEGNISLLSYQARLYYKVEYTSPAKLGTFRNAYQTCEQYEKMAQQVVDFAGARQGDSSGIAMLSQSRASWGLVSKATAEMEQTVSLIVGMKNERVVLEGYSVPEVERIRNSVFQWSKDIKVFSKVQSFQVSHKELQTADVSTGLYIIRGKTSLDSSLVATRMGKMKTYSPEEAIKKMWEHVEMAVSSASNVIYYAAGLPPLVDQMQIKVYPAGGAWASVFFFTQKMKITKASFGKQGLEYKEMDPISPSLVHKSVVQGMNNTVASWIVPPVNINFAFSALLAPMKVDKKHYISFKPENDEFHVQYLEDGDDTEIIDPEQEGMDRPRVVQIKKENEVEILPTDFTPGVDEVVDA